MNTIKGLLVSTGFTSSFLEHAEDSLVCQNGYVVSVDEPNLVKFLQREFAAHTASPRAVMYTNTALDALDGELHDVDQEESLRIQTRAITPGAGIHEHASIPGLYLFAEVMDMSQSHTLTTPKNVTRWALVSATSLEQIQTYVEQVRKTEKQSRCLRAFVHSVDGEWIQQRLPLRPIQSIFLEKLPKIMEDMSDFLGPASKAWYTKHGIPYKRTYLFHGNPGSGKSATIRAIASELDLPVYNLAISTARIDDVAFTELLKGVPRRSILVIEDIDRIYNNFNQNVSEGQLSFATLLNSLDGLLAKEEVLVVLTANDVDSLDSAIQRHSRIDEMYKFPDATRKTTELMFESFYPDEADLSEEFAKKHYRKDTPLAAYQQVFIQGRKRSGLELLGMKDTAIKRRKASSSRTSNSQYS
jgi:predicted AAA+ superfamily ATPase